MKIHNSNSGSYLLSFYKDDSEILEILTPENAKKLGLPMFFESVSAGFPSPADDYLEGKLDLNDYLVNNPAATFFVRVKGESMINSGIYSGDILIVDRSIEPKSGNIIIAVLNGELTVKRLEKKGKKVYLVPENAEFKAIEITNEMNFEVWGVVKTVIHSVM